MAYTAGFLNKVVSIYKCEMESGDFGRVQGIWTKVGEYHANIAFNKGQKSMREGALDAYDSVMIRMRWNDVVDRQSRIAYGDKTYQVESLNGDKEENQIQITAVEITAE